MGASPPRSPNRPYPRGFAVITEGLKGPEEDGPIRKVTKPEAPVSQQLDGLPPLLCSR